jgi:hypothetical protein
MIAEAVLAVLHDALPAPPLLLAMLLVSNPVRSSPSAASTHDESGWDDPSI